MVETILWPCNWYFQRHVSIFRPEPMKDTLPSLLPGGENQGLIAVLGMPTNSSFQQNQVFCMLPKNLERTLKAQ